MSALMPAAAGAPLRAAPSATFVVVNAVASQVGWFACVLGAAHGWAAAGTASVAVMFAAHLACVARPAQEMRLALAALALGAAFNAALIGSGAVVFVPGLGAGSVGPHWMLALWVLFALTLNVSLRWLKGRLALAAVLGAIAGPLSFAGGVRLGAATFVDRPLALALIGVGWALAMPALVQLAGRFDGVTVGPAR